MNGVKTQYELKHEFEIDLDLAKTNDERRDIDKGRIDPCIFL